MGDVTIYILIDSTLLGSTASVPTLPPASSSSQSTGTSAFQFQSISHVMSGDASLAELMNFVLSKVSLSNSTRGDLTAALGNLTILDISYHPAKVISPSVRKYTQTSGPHSKTLQSCGWYPSGKLVVLPSPSLSASFSGDNCKNSEEENLLKQFVEWQSGNVLQHEEFAYNNPVAAKKNDDKQLTGEDDADGTTSANVQWIGVGAEKATATKMKPSEIFNAVEQRSDHTNDTLENPKPKKEKQRRTEKQRTQRLDSLLQNLDTKSKNKKKKVVSDKVRTMLLKSRSEGNKKLRMEDRFHLEVVSLWDVPGEEDGGSSGDETSYRFFSRQATAGRVASTVAPNLGHAKAAELLISYPCTTSDIIAHQEKRYRRLPNTMSLHDAQNSKWVKDFDVVMVRVYALPAGRDDGDDVEQFGPSKSVLDPESDDEVGSHNNDEECDQEDCTNDADKHMDAMEVDDANYTAETTRHAQKQLHQQLQQRVHTIFQSLDENKSNGKPSKKKKKPVSKQMRSMLMKSKSTGNPRLKQEDRLYLEVIVFRDSSNDSGNVDPVMHSSSFRYFSKKNDMQHIITVCDDSSKDSSRNDNETNACVELIVQMSKNGATDLEYLYQNLPPSLTLGNAIQNGYIENCGRIMIRVCGDKSNSLHV